MTHYLDSQFTTTSRRHRLFAPTPTTSQLKKQALNLVDLYVADHLRMEARATVRRLHTSEQVQRFIDRLMPAPPAPAASDHTYNTEYNLPHTD